jgi:hypothetical protein
MREFCCQRLIGSGLASSGFGGRPCLVLRAEHSICARLGRAPRTGFRPVSSSDIASLDLSNVTALFTVAADCSASVCSCSEVIVREANSSIRYVTVTYQ